MPYHSVSEVPDHVPKDKRKQWMEVWNSVYDKTGDEGKAFAAANGVVKKDDVNDEGGNKVRKFDTSIGNGGNTGSANSDRASENSTGATSVNYTASAGNHAETCDKCLYYDAYTGHCLNNTVSQDPKVPEDSNGQKLVAAGGWCDQYELDPEAVVGGDGTVKARTGKYRKFIPFAKVDAAKREVWGIVTAEVPDKEDEVCDYAKTKPYYKAVIEEMSKATNGQNFFPLREMHQLSAVGKCVGFEFRDAEREIYMGFKVVDDDAWKKVDEGVYTGFSQGGRKVGEQLPDPVYKGCMRYTADPSEASLVDNPCLGVAHFAYINKTGQVEMRKFLRTEEAALVPLSRLSALIEKAITLRDGSPAVASGRPQGASDTPPTPGGQGRPTTVAGRVTLVKGKTKRVAGEDLPASAFAYVGDSDKTETWKLPIKFSTDEKTKTHIRNALARFSATQGIPAGERDKVHARIVAAAKQHGIDVDTEKALVNRIQKALRRAARVWVNKRLRTSRSTSTAVVLSKLRPDVLSLDDDLGKLNKGMYEVSRLAGCVQELGYLTYAVCNEQKWEGDKDSPLPEMVAECVDKAIEALIAMVQEETSELRAELEARLSGEPDEGMDGAVSPIPSL